MRDSWNAFRTTLSAIWEIVCVCLYAIRGVHTHALHIFVHVTRHSSLPFSRRRNAVWYVQIFFCIRHSKAEKRAFYLQIIYIPEFKGTIVLHGCYSVVSGEVRMTKRRADSPSANSLILFHLMSFSHPGISGDAHLARPNSWTHVENIVLLK